MSTLPLPAAGRSGNLFLDALPADSANALIARLEGYRGALSTVVAPSGQPLSHVYFPVGGVISSVARMQDGSGVEVLLTGRDGFYGIHLVLGSATSSNEAVVQIPAAFWRLPSAAFRAALDGDNVLRQRAYLYVQTVFEMTAQFSACNRLHPVNERCARWLLMCHDRVDGDELQLTHDYLATMLGVRRPSVSIAAATFDRAGLIEYRRGRIRITNRPLLEASACECYDVANDAFRRLLGYEVCKDSAAAGDPRATVR